MLMYLWYNFMHYFMFYYVFFSLYFFLFVFTDAAPSVAGAPGAPMDVTASDANKDYVLVSWKPPNTTNEPQITGYFVDR